MSDDCHGCNTQLFNSDSSLTFDSLKNLKYVNGFGKFSMIKFSSIEGHWEHFEEEESIVKDWIRFIGHNICGKLRHFTSGWWYMIYKSLTI